MPGRRSRAEAREKGHPMKKLASMVIVLVAALTLSACGNPVPQDKSAYVGEWHAPAMGLLITQDGGVAYKRLKQGVTTSINGPLRRFEGDDFVVGFPLLSTKFEVSKTPFRQAGVWKMVVDGVELTKVR
jgi:hypothetical protein